MSEIYLKILVSHLLNLMKIKITSVIFMALTNILTVHFTFQDYVKFKPEWVEADVELDTNQNEAVGGDNSQSETLTQSCDQSESHDLQNQ